MPFKSIGIIYMTWQSKSVDCSQRVDPMNCQRVDRVGCFHAIVLCCLCLAMVKSEHSSIMLSMTQVSLLRAGSLSHTHLIMLHKWAKSFKGNLGAFFRNNHHIIVSLSHQIFRDISFLQRETNQFHTYYCPIWKCLKYLTSHALTTMWVLAFPCKFMSRSIR